MHRPFNYNLGNLQQAPPLRPDLFHQSIFFNPLAAQLTSSVLGGTPILSFISGNTAIEMEGCKGQPVHSDADFAHPSVPFACVVNVGLGEMMPENGSTGALLHLNIQRKPIDCREEIWLGTHNDSGLHVQEGAHGERASGRITATALEERARISPPLQPNISKGHLGPSPGGSVY